jgi:NADH-quinone oxidoreductase subunit N
MLFKLGVFPFQVWVANVYGSGLLTTVFILATISKVFAFGIFIRFLGIFGSNDAVISVVFYYAGLISIVYGVLGAFFQTEIRKVLGYSAIAHVGYVLLMFSFFDRTSLIIALLYFFSYIFLTFFIFYFLITTSHQKNNGFFSRKAFKPFFYLQDFAGLSKSNWFISFFLAVLFFSYAGVPPFMGFYAKYFIFYYLVQQGYYFTFMFCFCFSVLSSYYYLSIVVFIYFKCNDAQVKFIKNMPSNKGMFIFCVAINFFSIFLIDPTISFIWNYFSFL